MPDIPPTSPTTPPSGAVPSAPKAAARGYFNQAQLADVEEAKQILAAALAALQITPEYLTGLEEAVIQARGKITETGQGGDVKKTATLKVTGKARALLTALQGIQSAAKQKRRMFDEDDDPSTEFSVAGYLINQRLNPNRELFLQNAHALITKATATTSPATPPPRSKKSPPPSPPTNKATKTARTRAKKPPKTASPATN